MISKKIAGSHYWAYILHKPRKNRKTTPYVLFGVLLALLSVLNENVRPARLFPWLKWGQGQGLMGIIFQQLVGFWYWKNISGWVGYWLAEPAWLRDSFPRKETECDLVQVPIIRSIGCCIDPFLREAKTHQIGWFLYLFPNSGWPPAPGLFWKSSSIFVLKTLKKNTMQIIF